MAHIYFWSGRTAVCGEEASTTAGLLGRPLHAPASPQVVLQQAGKGAMHTFTREFYHPEDRVPEVSPEAAERFYADQRRFPPGGV